ncbi:hypothetical protein LXL04_003609 [Taraxacum kok-saghyz]
MPLNTVSLNSSKLPSFLYAANGETKKKSLSKHLIFNIFYVGLVTLCRFVMSNSKHHALDSENGSIQGLYLLKLSDEVFFVNPVQLHQGLESCSTMKELRQYHSQIIKLGLSCDNDAIGRVIKFCAISKTGDLGYALKVFDKLPEPDPFIYNTMFRGYVQFQLAKECISLYSQMLQSCVTPNKFSFPPVTRACSFHNTTEEGKQVHAQIFKFGYSSDGFSQNNLIHMYVSFKHLKEARRVFDKMPHRDPISWTTLITGYSQLGYIHEARQLFDKMPERNPASWNAMISAYVQTNRFQEALLLFNEMQSNHMKLDKYVAASMLSACTGLGALKQGEWIHDYINKNGIEIDPKLASTIIDMYSKCGSLEKALETFNTLTKSKSVSVSVSSWNSMMGGFAMHGKGDSAIDLFNKMESESESISPDYITFVNLLSACAHSGLIKKGLYYFKHMKEFYNISPGMEHYGCMVDMLGRAGMFDSAMNLINDMPMDPDVGVMGALLGACKIHKNVKLGEEIGKKVIELEPHNSGRYVLLANIYAAASNWESVAEIRKLMNDRCVKKEAGFSQIEIGGIVNEFIAGGIAHRDSKKIYEKVGEMLEGIKSMGYVPESEGVSEEDLENPVFYHSEKLAIAYGLLTGKPGEVLRVTKNLRVCKDCHEVSKLVSKFYGREIIVRDRNRFHHFRDGVCSCNDYW